jgi:hypothetical protein
MARKVIGPTGSRRRLWLLLGCLVLVAGVAVVLIPGASAESVKGQTFQLDGNIAQDPPTPQVYDWTNFFGASGNKLALPTDYTASSFTRDFNTKTNGTFDTSDTSTYTQGSKDILPIGTGWACAPANNVTDKGDIMNAYSAAYTDPTSGDKIVYFALERNANTGDANVAFWFLQGGLSCPSAGGSFAGDHRDGDLLIVSAFTNGGSVSTINAYRWNGGANGALGTTPVATGGDCKDTAKSGDPTCATSNTGTLSSIPWPTENKTDGVGHTLRTSEFFEGGIDLSTLGLGNTCFNTFLADTRSSQSLTATLYDFSVGNLGECTSTTTTTPVDATDTSQPPASSIPASPANAAVTVKDQTVITVTGISSFNAANTANLSWHICGPTASSTQLCDGTAGNVGVAVGSQAIQAAGTYTSPTVTLTEAGRYCFRADFAGDSVTGVPASSDSRASECFTIAPVTPTISTNAGAGPVDFGNPVTDTAALSGTAKKKGSGGPTGSDGSINPVTLGGVATGTITFTLYKSDCSTLATGTGTNPQAVAVSDNGTYGPVSFTPDTPGLYYWNATYGGDPPNTNASPASNSPCPDANEAVTVRQIPTSVQTKQDWIPNDTATISASTGNLVSGGSVRFQLYSTSNCGGSALYDQTIAVPGGSPSAEVNTTNSGSGAGSLRITTGYTDAKPSTAGPYSWKVTYTPAAGDTAHLGSSSACNAENFSTTYNNDPGS